jgi:cation diffusion facilitator family transporter
MASHGSTKRSVVVSIISGVSIATIKSIAGLFTNSSAMISEAIHSWVDSFNSVFLLLGDRAGRRPPSSEYPLGHGRETYFWTVIVGVSIFAGGGAMSVYEGVTHLLEREEAVPSVWSYVVLGIAAIFEGWTTAAAYREFRAVKTRKRLTLWGAFRASTDLTTFVVLFENGAALLGIVIAAVGIGVSQALGSPYPDGIASILIGALLGVVAFLLIRESKGLIVGEGMDRQSAQEMRAVIQANPNVEEILTLLTLHTGPREVLAAMDLRFRPEITAARLVEVIDDVESSVRARFPEVTRIFIEADRIIETARATSPAGSGDLTPAPT